MSIALVAPIIGVIALSVAIAGWDAAVFARRHFEQPRERLMAWARECGEAFDLLMIPGCETLKQQQPPIRYGLRAYLIFDLVNDLDELDNFSRPRVGNLHYVETRILPPVKRAIRAAMWRWSEIHGMEPDKSATEDAVSRRATYGLQRVGMLQEHVLRYERMPWILTVVRRVQIHRRIHHRRKQRSDERIENSAAEVDHEDIGVPL
ncbi:hypothetical protein PP577_17080 [Mycobacteroides abscessus]|nr:hypothetical protein [Mycobacteroides abscessus]MDM2425890.1 hypothetical protein [Mycobacteroides abscessus]MDM2431511.1 hypothetical protein [Mycobacteroides abscessus]MDM2436203.1 hypothetical protein [Mycobacteroides abscessus]MDM2440503.1 hypothetical protein [Mycobacteroides abscessus]